jgi:hypothetical protein
MISFDPRYAYFVKRYESKKEAGICTRNGCNCPAVPDRVLCEKHRARSQAYWHRSKARREAA